MARAGMTDQKEFYEEFCKAGWVKSPASAEILWLAFCKLALDFMVNRQKPIDMGFCKIVPVPLRANWKAMFYQEFFKRFGVRPWACHPQLLPTMAELFTNDPRFIAWRKPHRLLWTLEVIPEKGWHRASMEYRAKPRGNGFPVKFSNIREYTGWASQSIKRALPLLKRLYAAYLSNIKNPGARLIAIRLPSGKASKRLEQRRGATVWPDAPVVDSGCPDARGVADAVVIPEGLEDTDGENPGMRGLPDLRQETADMRRTEC